MEKSVWIGLIIIDFRQKRNLNCASGAIYFPTVAENGAAGG